MLTSIDTLLERVSGPLGVSCGPEAKVLTAEMHGEEVRGLAICPGKVVRYVLAAQASDLRTADLLTLMQGSRHTAQKE